MGHLKRLVTPIIVSAMLLIAGLAFAAPTDVPAAPVAVNIPPAQAVDARPPDGTSPAPISPDAPRTGPTPAGQTIPEDYRIGPRDLIEIQVFGVETLRHEVRVNSRGAISLALIGTVALGGLTVQEAEALLTAKYEKDFLQNPHVSIFIKEFTTQWITVEGAVGRPGVFPLKDHTSLLQVMAMVGGGAAMADLTEVMLFRAENGVKKMVKYDVLKIRKGELPDPVMMNDDLLVVSRSAARAALKDSLFRDIVDTINPFSYMKP